MANASIRRRAGASPAASGLVPSTTRDRSRARSRSSVRLRYLLESQMTVRRAAVAGTWYPDPPTALRAAVDGHLAAAGDAPRAPDRLVALIAPHAGLMYSGPVAAHAYRLLRDRPLDVAVLVGPVALRRLRRRRRCTVAAASRRRSASRRSTPTARASSMRGVADRARASGARTHASTRSRCSCRFSARWRPTRRSCRW